MTSRSGRVFEPEIAALAAAADPYIEVRAPAVGLWREAPLPGTLVRPGDAIGRLEVLGVLHRIIAPAEAHGIVVEPADNGDDSVPTASDSRLGDLGASLRDRARCPLVHGQRMLTLDPAVAAAAGAQAAAQAATPTSTAEGIAFRAPTSGRFYGRPSPDKPPFVTVGEEIEIGRTVCLLEVMKTFNRVAYGGEGMPERARIKAVLPSDDADLAAGDIILLLE